MKFTNLTRSNEIGANSYLLELTHHNVVLDAGMHPKFEGEDALPNFSFIPDGEIDAVLISHSHLDHIGSLPVLLRRQPQARVFMTSPSVELGSSLLHNSSNVMMRYRSSNNTQNPALFGHHEIEVFKKVWYDCALNQPYDFSGERIARNSQDHKQTSFELFDAGHILGSAGILIHDEGKTLFYTGDVNFTDQTISRSADFPQFEPGTLDVLVIETTRGAQATPPDFTRQNEELRFANAISEALQRGGAILIPVFALGKTQEVLAMLYSFKQKGLLSTHTPVFIGGLSTKMTETYDHFADSVPRHLEGLELFNATLPNILRGPTAGKTEITPGCIYALSSGMMTENTLSHVFAQRMLSNSNHSIFFVGYADPESIAGKLKPAKTGDWVQLVKSSPSTEVAQTAKEADTTSQDQSLTKPTLPNPTLTNQSVQVQCHLDQFDFSAHAYRESLLSYIQTTSPKKVILVHGDTAALEWFKESIQNSSPGIEVIIPLPGQTLEL